MSDLIHASPHFQLKLSLQCIQDEDVYHGDFGKHRRYDGGQKRVKKGKFLMIKND